MSDPSGSLSKKEKIENFVIEVTSSVLAFAIQVGVVYAFVSGLNWILNIRNNDHFPNKRGGAYTLAPLMLSSAVLIYEMMKRQEPSVSKVDVLNEKSTLPQNNTHPFSVDYAISNPLYVKPSLHQAGASLGRMSV